MIMLISMLEYHPLISADQAIVILLHARTPSLISWHLIFHPLGEAQLFSGANSGLQIVLMENRKMTLIPSN